MIYLCNTFSLHMLKYVPCGQGQTIEITHISAMEAGTMLREHAFRSYFGHHRTAFHLGRYLRVTVPVCRGTIAMEPDDVLLVAASQSKRDRESGRMRLPKWRFYTVQLRANDGATDRSALSERAERTE